MAFVFSMASIISVAFIISIASIISMAFIVSMASMASMVAMVVMVAIVAIATKVYCLNNQIVSESVTARPISRDAIASKKYFHNIIKDSPNVSLIESVRHFNTESILKVASY